MSGGHKVPNALDVHPSTVVMNMFRVVQLTKTHHVCMTRAVALSTAADAVVVVLLVLLPTQAKPVIKFRKG